jgi:uncharacterized protein YjdB
MIRGLLNPSRRWLAASALFALAASAVACLDDSPVATGTPTVHATLSANVVANVAGGTVDIRVGYRGSQQQFVPLRSSPQRIEVAPASTIVLPLTVDIGPCLADASRLAREEGGCALIIELTLSDAAGERIDSQTREAREAVLPGESVNFGTVTIGVSVSTIVLAPATVSMAVSDQQALSATVRDASGASVTTVPVEWTTSDATVVQVTPGTATSASLRGLKLGTATVTATAGGRTSNAVTVTVVPPAPLTVRQRPTSGCVIVGQTVTLEVDSPPGAIAWSSANAAIASVGGSTGVVTGITVGQVVITATSGARTGTASVCVTGPLRVTPTALPLTAGRTGQISATGVTGGTLTYSSSATSIATVDASGLVRGVGVGSATVTTTFTAPSGTQTATTAVTVAAASLVVGPTSGSAALTRTARFTASALDANGATIPGVAVAWSISDATVGSLSATSGAAVDVRALKIGSTTVRATLGSLSASALFNAVAPLPPARLEKVAGDGAVCPTRSTSCTFTVRAVDVNGVPSPGATVQWSANSACGPARIVAADENGLATTTNICSAMPAGQYTQLATLQANQQQASFSFTLRGLRVQLEGFDSFGAAIFLVTAPDGIAAGLSVAIEYKSGPISNYVSQTSLNKTTTPALLTVEYYDGQMPFGNYTFDVVVSTTTPGIGPGVDRYSFLVDYESGFKQAPNAPRSGPGAPASLRTPGHRQ